MACCPPACTWFALHVCGPDVPVFIHLHGFQPHAHEQYDWIGRCLARALPSTGCCEYVAVVWSRRLLLAASMVDAEQIWLSRAAGDPFMHRAHLSTPQRRAALKSEPLHVLTRRYMSAPSHAPHTSAQARWSGAWHSQQALHPPKPAPAPTPANPCGLSPDPGRLIGR